MRSVFFALVLVLTDVVRGLQDKSSSRETDPLYYDLDHGSDNFILESNNLTTTAKPRHHVHPLEMASDLNIPDLCKCFSKIEVSQDCMGRYPDNLRILRNGSIQMAYVTDDKNLVNSKSLPLIIVSSGQQKNLVLLNETLVLVCEMSLGAFLENIRFHHISRIHVAGQILQARNTVIHLAFSKISTPIRFSAGSLHLLPIIASVPGFANAAPAAKKLTSNNQRSNNSSFQWMISDSTSLLVSLRFIEYTSVAFESNSVVVPELMINAEHVDLLKFYPEAIKITSPKPILALRVFNSRMLTMQTNAITYANLDVAADVCGQLHRVVDFQGIQQLSFTQNAMKLLPCTNLTLRNIYLTHTEITALTNLPKSTLNWVLITHVKGNGNLVPGAICLLANSVKVAETQIYTQHLYEEDEGDVIWLAGVKSLDVVEGSLVGVRSCQQQEVEVVGIQGCQICQDKKVSNTTVSPTGSYVLKQAMQDHLQDPSQAAEETSFNLLEHNMLLLYLVVAAAIFILTIIAAFIIHRIHKRKKKMSWKVPSLPWAKSQHNIRHPALAAKAAYRASRNVSDTTGCYTIFDSIAAAKQGQLTSPSQNAKENQPIEEEQDQQESNYSEPVDSIASSRRDSHVYANPSNIKGAEGGSIDRSSAFSDRRLSAATDSVASSIANLNMISALSAQDRRKSSYGLLIDITSALGIESNYKQLTNK